MRNAAPSALVVSLLLLGAGCGDEPGAGQPQPTYAQPGVETCRGDLDDAVRAVAPHVRVTTTDNDLDRGGLTSLTCTFTSSQGVRGGLVPTVVDVLIYTDGDGDDDVRRIHAGAGDQAFVDLVDVPLEGDERVALADGWWDDGFARHGYWRPGRPGIGGPGLLSQSGASVRDANLNVQVAVTRSGVPRLGLDDARAADRDLARAVLSVLDADLVRR